MPNYTYYLLVFNNLSLQIICILLAAIPTYFIGKYYTMSWFDPLRISLIYVVFSNAVPLFLYSVNEIPLYIFYNFLISESLFWIGFIFFAKRKIYFSTKNLVQEGEICNKLYFIFGLLFLTITIIGYIKFGLPIFSDSRISTFVDSGGFGIFSRISPFLSLYILMYSYYQLEKKTSPFYTILAIFFLIIIAITGILSGSKSGFLLFVYAYFGYKYFFKGEPPNTKVLVKYSPILIFSAMSVILISNGGSIFESLQGLLYRLTSSGDCYYMGYPNEIIKQLDVGNSWRFLFSNILVPMRLMDGSTVPPTLGAQLTWILFPNLDGLLLGPNSRPTFLSFALFGWNGLYFSLFLGSMTSFLIYRLPRFFPKGFLTSFLMFYIYLNSITFITDPTAGLAIFFDLIVNFSITAIFAVLLHTISRNKYS